MRLSAIKAYVGATAIFAVVALFTIDWSFLGSFEPTTTAGRDAVFGWVALLVLGLFSESLTLSITVAKSAGSTSSIIFLPLLTSIVLFGPGPTVLFIAVTGVLGEFLIRRKEPIRAIFNSSQYVLSSVVAGHVWIAFGGDPLALSAVGGEVRLFDQLPAFFAFGSVFLIFNHGAVSVAIALNERVKLRKVWLGLIGRTGTNLFYDLLVSPIAIAISFLYLQVKFAGLFLIILPLLFVRYAYQSILQLQRANRDLLTALVKAMETRDPYTSGHSLRVASLSVRIADALGLTPNRQKDVETAALLHDIGKIEAAYSEILSKPEGLTDHERSVIQSHVTKGVEILQQLSSVSSDVVAAVRGHHERVDGKGYPDGLRGAEIPMAARIIKVCDAIDAMLSDRPYRRALTLEQVREQLVIYSGTQFDLEVVKAAIEGELLEAHQAEIMLQKEESESEKGLSRGSSSVRMLRA